MKLKNLLILAFLILTLIPIAVASLLLYRSGFNLSKESYTRNLVESINVQVDYISQTIENNMVMDYRFANRNYSQSSRESEFSSLTEKNVYPAFQAYLEASEDKITVGILLDKDDVPLYTIGEKSALDSIMSQMPKRSQLSGQSIMEFELEPDTFSLGIVTPIWDENKAYAGKLISIYDKSYIFKIISSYYKIADTSTYICRANGEIINFIGSLEESRQILIQQALGEQEFSSEGTIDMHINNVPVSGYYKNINNSPWYLVGFIDDQLIHSFTNKFVLIYILIIIGVLIVDLILAFYFSQKVVEPINDLIKVMNGYQNSLNSNDLQYNEKNGYYETRYLRTKFLELMKTILLVQHNFEGIYQLYQSSDMGDTNIDIDVMEQTIGSNKEVFQKLMHELDISQEGCIIERFTHCFCEKDRNMLTAIFENMRDEHLSVTREAEVYSPYLNQKWFHAVVVPMYQNERLSRLFVQLRDISSFKIQELASSEQARRDSLTGLYNRSGFAERVSEALESGNESDMHGLLFIDMDYFKLVNDNFGHSVGDELLRAIGRDLENAIGPQDSVSRFGGDEFAVFLPRTSPEEITKVKDELNWRLVYPYHKDKASFVVSASVGEAIWEHTAPDTLEQLLKQADESMYEAKRAFKQQEKK